MERWIEHNPRGDDDDEEDFGSVDDAKKNDGEAKPAWTTHESTYRSLDKAGDAEQLWKRAQAEHQTILRNLLEQPAEEYEDDEEDKDDDDEESDEDDASQVEDKSADQDDAPEVSHDDEQYRVTVPAAVEPQQSFSRVQPAEKPAWQTEDDKKFDEIMGGMDQGFSRAASGDLLTAQHPGTEAPAIENTHNEQVTIEPELTHAVAGYDAVQDRQYEGYTPGPPPSAEVSSYADAVEGRPRVTPIEAPIDVRPPDAPPRVVERVPDVRVQTVERPRSLREKMMAAMLVTAAVSGYFANKRRKREIQEQAKEHRRDIQQQQAVAERLAAEQQTMRQQVASQEQQYAAIRAAQQREAANAPQMPQMPERPFVPPQPEQAVSAAPSSVEAGNASAHAADKVAVPATPAKSEQAIAEDAANAARRAIEEARQAQVIAAEPPKQRRVEQDAWRRYVVDEHGHEVQNAVQYGEEYAHERQQEILPDQVAVGTAKPKMPQPQLAGHGVVVGGVPHPTQSQSGQSAQHPQQSIDSGLTPPDHSLPAGMPTPADWQHRLPEKNKRNQVVAALTSPWLFLMLSLILLAYFIASLL